MKKTSENRILYIDLLKAISILMMVFIHVLSVISTLELANLSFNEELAYNISGIFNLFTPTIFMLCMGCGLYLSKNKTPGKLAKRGLKLLWVGFLLNIFRGFFFFLLLAVFKHSPSYIYEAWYWLWGSDIMYFAGLFFLLYALLRKLKLKDIHILIIGILMFILSCFIFDIKVKNDTLNMLVGNFIYLNIDSYFPLITWTIFPIIGYFYQKYFDKVKDKDYYVAMVSLISFIIFGITLVIFKITGIFKIRYLMWAIDEQIIDAPTFILTTTINFVYIGIIYFLTKLIKSSKVSTLIHNISSKVNIIYFIHWNLIMYIGLLFYIIIPLKVTKIYEVFIITLIIYIISILIANYFQKFRKKTKKSK